MATARIWREQSRRYRNEISICRECGHRHYPPRDICEECGRAAMEPGVMADTGQGLTFTVIRVPPPDLAAEIPYVVAILEMDDGARTMAQLADVAVEEVEIGMRVRLAFRRIRRGGHTGVIAYGHKAVPE